MRRAAKIDANQSEIVRALRDLGASVEITSSLGSGFPDCAVGFDGLGVLVEIKDGSLSPSKRRLTDREQKFHDSWKGGIAIVENITEAIDLFDEMNRVGRILRGAGWRY